MNTDKHYAKSFILLVFFLVFVLFFQNYIEPKIISPAREEAIREEDLLENFSGKVVVLYNETDNHNIKCARLNNAYIFRITPLWEREFEVGDSLVKKKNSLSLKIYRRAGGVKELNYEDTYKKSTNSD